jgi:acetyltransferase-like isoleucine patch superfamily enzyme
MNKIISGLIGYLKNEEYQINYNFSFIELLLILKRRLFEAIRGFFLLKLFVNKSKGLLFVQKGVEVLFANRISVGKNMQLRRYSKINALSIDGVNIGNNFMLGEYAIIECAGVLNNIGSSLSIGDNVAINHYCFISVRGNIEIGDNVIFGPRVNVFSENHNFDKIDIPIKNQGTTQLNTTIGSDVWIGSSVSIMSGITIGTGCVLAAGSVVTEDVPDFSIYGGVPAKLIRNR